MGTIPTPRQWFWMHPDRVTYEEAAAEWCHQHWWMIFGGDCPLDEPPEEPAYWNRKTRREHDRAMRKWRRQLKSMTDHLTACFRQLGCL